ncbi:MAG: S41 family peptidase [Clostridiales bacterium]|nr:S41 family peptidase [Clostridiales bacterium]
MKKFLTVFSALLLALSFGLNICFAESTSESETADEAEPDIDSDGVADTEEDDSEETYYFDDYVSAGGYLAGVIEYIEKNYVGGDVDIEKLIEAAVTAMASSLDDYSEYYTADEYESFMQGVSNEVYATGFAFIVTEDYPQISELIQQSPAQKAGLLAGDKITVINGESTLYKSYGEIDAMLTNVDMPEYSFTILRNNKTFEVSFNLEAVKVNTVFHKEMDDLFAVDSETDWDEIAYIQITVIGSGTAEEFKEAVTWARQRGMNKLILDLRGNSGGIVDEAVEICRQIIPEGRIMYTQDKTGNIEETFSTLKKPPFKEIAVLTNSMTASAAEIIASAVKESEIGFSVGTTTYGKGVVQTIASLPSLGMLKLTTLEYFTRNGNIINGVGVEPDIEISTMYLVSENDEVDSDKMKDIYRYLGYKVETDGDAKRALATFQTKTGIPATVKLDAETVNSLNLALYARSVEHDDALEKAFTELLKVD